MTLHDNQVGFMGGEALVWLPEELVGGFLGILCTMCAFRELTYQQSV